MLDVYLILFWLSSFHFFFRLVIFFFSIFSEMVKALFKTPYQRHSFARSWSAAKRFRIARLKDFRETKTVFFKANSYCYYFFSFYLYSYISILTRFFFSPSDQKYKIAVQHFYSLFRWIYAFSLVHWITFILFYFFLPFMISRFLLGIGLFIGISLIDMNSLWCLSFFLLQFRCFFSRIFISFMLSKAFF